MSSLITSLVITTILFYSIFAENVNITGTTCNYVYDDTGIDTPRSPGYCNLRHIEADSYYIINNTNLFEGWQYECNSVGSLSVLYKTSSQPFTTCDDGDFTEYTLQEWISLIGSPVGYQCGMDDCNLLMTIYRSSSCENYFSADNIWEISAFTSSNDICYEADTEEYVSVKCYNDIPSYVAYSDSACNGDPKFVGSRPNGLCQSDDGYELTYIYTVYGQSHFGDCLDTDMPTTGIPTTNTPTTAIPTTATTATTTDIPTTNTPTTAVPTTDIPTTNTPTTAVPTTATTTSYSSSTTKDISTTSLHSTQSENTRNLSNSYQLNPFNSIITVIFLFFLMR